MQERHLEEIKDLPQEATLGDAFRLNQILWRNRDHTFNTRVSVEISEEITQPIFKKVLSRYKSSVDPLHLENFPIVSYSKIPEVPVFWGPGIYFPILDRHINLDLFVEFGTEWLAIIACGGDPVFDNVYMGEVDKIMKEEQDLSREKERLLLGGIISTYLQDAQTAVKFTEFFNLFLLEDREKLLNKAVIVTESDGRQTRLDIFNATETSGSVSGEEIPTLHHKSKLNFFTRTFIRRLCLEAIKVMETRFRQSGAIGTCCYPGVVNLSVMPGDQNFEKTVVHEYLHQLSFRENSWCGQPLLKYSLGGGIFFGDKAN